MTLSRQQIEEIARGTEGYAPDAVLGYPVRTIRAITTLALQALAAGQPVAVTANGSKSVKERDDALLIAKRLADSIPSFDAKIAAAEAEAATLREALERALETIAHRNAELERYENGQMQQ
jgi:uncharacterized protein YlxW (UPF0749 family)